LKNTLTKKRIICFIIGMFSVINMFFRLFYGWDQDESLIVILAERIASGKVLFRDIWDLGQTCGLLPAIFVKIYKAFTIHIMGLGLYLRVVSLGVQLLISFYAYKILRKYYGKYIAFITANVVANMLPRATQELEYGTTSVWAAIVCSLILLDAYNKNHTKIHTAVISGLLYSLSVFTYPTMIITVPFFMFIIWKISRRRIWFFVLFWFTCAGTAVAFFGYIIANMPMTDFVAVLREFGKNGDHSTLFKAFKSYDLLLKSSVRIIGSSVIALLIGIIIKVTLKVKIEAFYIYIFFTTLGVLALNMFGLRPSGPFGFLERYIGAVVLAFPIIKKHAKFDMVSMFYCIGICYYMGALMGSNLGFNENVMFLEMSIVAVVIAALKIEEGTLLAIRDISVVTFVLGIIVSSGYFVRVDSTKPANIFQCTQMVQEGPLKNIKITDEKYYNTISKGDDVTDCSSTDAVHLMITRDPIYNLYIRGDYNAVMYTTTAQYNEQWVDYYENFDHDLPDIIIVDKALFKNTEAFRIMDFGNYALTKYYLDETNDNEYFFRLLLND